MAIGKKQVNAMNLNRVVTVKTKAGEELAVCRFNGTQRDAYMTLMFEVRDRFKKDGVEAEGLKKLDAATMPAEQAKMFTDMEYRLIAMSIVDGDALAIGQVKPLFDSAEEVALQLEPETIREWVAVCNEVNGLGDKEERKIAADFTATPNGASGSSSPACADAPTSPG